MGLYMYLNHCIEIKMMYSYRNTISGDTRLELCIKLMQYDKTVRKTRQFMYYSRVEIERYDTM